MLVVRVRRVLLAAGASARLGAASLALSPLACGFPAPEACELACGEDGACPGGFECQASSALCVPRGTTLACLPAAVAPNLPAANGDDDAGVGGAGPAGADDAAAGGTSAAGAPALEALSIVVVGAASESACTGVELGRSLQASGGEGPYAWRVVEAPPGARSAAGRGERFELDGVPSEPGRVLVEVADANGQTARAEVVVHERPRVELERLPAICEGEGYAAWLAASGGEPDTYEWSAELVGDSAATLEALGLSVEGPWLTGEGVAGRDEGPLRLIVDVRDAHCRSSGVELELEVISSESDACPTIEIVDSPDADALPSPCRGSFYQEALTVTGGEEPYLWSELSVPPGLWFDPDTATLQGIPEGDGVLTVEVTDADAHTVQKSYEVEARDRCWLAYIASEPAPAHLELVDGRLIERQPAARRSLPEAAGADSVVDFQFSPDGRFIAYRLAGPSAPRLELARVSNGRSQPIATGGAVAGYAWSNDTSTLAISFDAAGQSLLGGIDVSAVDAESLDPDAALDGVRELAAVTAPPPDSALAWYADGRLAFLGSAAAGRRLVTARLEQGGFAPPSERGGFSSAARVLGAAGGVFVAEPATGQHEFFADGVEPPALHAEGAVISPSGAYAGLARSGALQIFRPARPSSPAGAPSFEASGCSTLLAWSGTGQRIACADVRGAEQRVVWFDISEAGDAIRALGSLSGAGASGEGAGHRRAFSESGRWFAFSTIDGVSVARVEPGPPELALELPASALGAVPSVLSFSPDESWLALGAANSLGLIDLEQGTVSPVALSPSALFNELCSERFVDGAADWCGSASREPDVSWSVGSDLIAFRSSLGTLQVIDLSRAREGRIGPPLSPDSCFEGCSSSTSARFQPERSSR